MDAMLREIEARGDVNIFSYLKHIRAQRNHLVQTEEQYIFIHDALVEVIEAGETHINKTVLPRYIHSLQCIDVTDEKNHPPKVLEKQHKVNINNILFFLPYIFLVTHVSYCVVLTALHTFWEEEACVYIL
jgi:hypothetical protein